MNLFAVIKNTSKQQRQVVILYCSTLLGTLLGVLCSIINTRYLDPVDYGDVRYVQNIIGFIASLLLFGYFLSGSRLLALSKEEAVSRRIRGAMIVILIAASVVLILATGINALFHSNEKIAFLFVVSMPVCLQPLLLNYINTTAQGDNHIGRLSATRLLPMAVYVPIAYLIYSTWGATSVRMVLLQWGIYTIFYTIIIISTKPSFNNLRPVFKELNEENKAYGLQLYYGSLFMIASNYLAGITLGMFNEDNVNVGYYTLALTVTTPLASLPGIIGTTYFKRFASESRIPIKVIKATVAITAASCILFILLIKPLVLFLYSKEYAQVGTYASWMAVGWSVQGIGDMINRYLGSHGEGKSIRNSSIASGTFKIFGFSFLVYLWDINGAILTNVVSSFIYFSCLCFYYKRFLKKHNEV